MNDTAERRVYCRLDASGDSIAAAVASGVFAPVKGCVRNISRGGVLLGVNDVPADASGVGRCVVQFHAGDDQVLPSVARGTIVRTNISAAGVQLAIEFREPLMSLPA